MPDHVFNGYEFHSPSVFFNEARKTFKDLPSQNPWESSAKLLREQWEIGNFAVGLSLLRRQSVEVRLSDEEPADGQLKVDGQLIDVQTRVLIRRGRRPAWEYRDREVSLEEQRQNAIEVSPEEATQWIRQAVEAKQDKQYTKQQKPFWLLIYATFATRGLNLDALVCAVRELCPSNFDEVWLLTEIIHSSDNDGGFAIVPLYPATKGEFFPYEYRATSERALGLRDIKPHPFGPLTVEARKPTVAVSRNDGICSPMFALTI